VRKLALLILMILPAGPVPASEWVSLRGNAQGRASITYGGAAELREWHYTYKSGRRYKPGLAVWASPALALIDGKPMAFIGGYDQTMHALELTEKKVLWRKVTNGEIASAPAIGRVGGLDVVFWGSADRTVYAYVTYNGRKLWTKELVEATTSLGDVNLSSPLLHDGRLYIACFAYDRALRRSEQKAWLFCLDMRNGEVLWKLVVSNGFISSPVGFELDGRFHVAIAARKGLLQCFDVSGAKLKRAWHFQMPHEVFGSPAVGTGKDNPLLFLGSKFGNLIAIDARTGEEKWQQMAGNWIDNSACIGEIDGRNVVYVGSHDYCVYAFAAADGEELWKRNLGGEVYSAPSFFTVDDEAYIAASSLDNHLYVLNARDGSIVTSYFTGTPIWDKVPKGDTLWGSPAVVSAGTQTVAVHGSFNNTVYVLPLMQDCTLRAQARSSAALWWSLLVMLAVFLLVLLPAVVSIPSRKREIPGGE
jgi:outer membrane protein assembly factor BamB